MGRALVGAAPALLTRSFPLVGLPRCVFLTANCEQSSIRSRPPLSRGPQGLGGASGGGSLYCPLGTLIQIDGFVSSQTPLSSCPAGFFLSAARWSNASLLASTRQTAFIILCATAALAGAFLFLSLRQMLS